MVWPIDHRIIHLFINNILLFIYKQVSRPTTNNIFSSLKAFNNFRNLPLDAWFPFNWQKSPNYELTFLLQLFGQILMTIPYGNADLLFACTVIMISKQFDILAHNIKNIYFYELLSEGFNRQDIIDFFKYVYEPFKTVKKDFSETIYKTIESKEFNNKIERRFKCYIQVHQSLYTFCDEIQTFFSPILLLSYFYGTFYIVFIGFCVIIVRVKICLL